jgi:HEAT repeat protein
MSRSDRIEYKELVKNLQSDNALERDYAAHDLGWHGSRAIGPLILALDDESPDVQKSAIQSLGLIGGDRAFHVLESIVIKNDGKLRSRAAHALGSTGDPRAFDLLLKMLQDTDEYSDTRLASASSLGMLGDPRALEPLVEALNDESTGARSGATNGLRSLRDKRAVEPLMQLLGKETHESICATAIYALQDFGDERALPILEHIRDADEREDIFYGKLSDLAAVAVAEIRIRSLPTIDDVIRAFEQADIFGRKAAIHVLCDNYGQQTVDFLISTLVDQDEATQKEAIWALEKIGGNRAKAALGDRAKIDDKAGKLADTVVKRMSNKK